MDKLARWIRLCVLTGFTALTTAFSSATEFPPATLRDFTPGLATKEDAADICDTCAQDLSNVDLNTGAIEKRRGSVKANSTVLGSFATQPTRFVHEFVDSSNNSWLLTVSSNTLFKSNDGGATNNIITSTHGVTSTSRFCGTNAFGYARLTDGTTNWMLFDGSTLSVSTASPKGLTCEFFGERILTSIGSTFYASRFGNGEDWTADAGTDNDAFSTQIRQSDGYSIRAIKRFKYGVLVLKDYSTDLFTLSADGLTFVQTSVSNTVGTQYPESVVERENDVIWLAHDGYYSFNGSQLKKISEIIRPTIEQIQQLSSFQRSYSESSASDFGNGSHTRTSQNITAGSVNLSTATLADTLNADFNSGTTSNTSVINDRVYLSTNNVNVPDSGYTTYCAGGGGSTADWTAVGMTSCVSGQPRALTSNADLVINILDTSGNVLTSSTHSISSFSSVYSQSMASYAGRFVKYRFCLGDCTHYLETTDAFLANGNDCTINVFDVGATIFVNPGSPTSGKSSITSGTFTSRSFDTTWNSSATWLTSSANSTANNHSISFQTQSSFDGSNWESAVSWTPGTSPTSSNARYLRYVVTLSTGGTMNGTALPFVSDATLNARSLTGRYLSTSINTGSATSWGTFTGNTDVSSGGSITFEVYTDTDTSIDPSNAATFTSSQTITNAGTPTLAIGAFAHVGSTFSITTGTQDPAMTDFTLVWNEGASLFPVSSIYYQGSYISSVALNRTDRNDTMLVYDINGAWTKYTFPAYYLARYRQRPYFGSAIQGDIVRFQYDGIYEDYDGTAIDAYWVSKEFDFGFPLTPKTMNRYYVTAKYRANDQALFEWGVDRGSLTSESTIGILDLDLNSGFFRKSITPSSLTYKKGLTHRFKISNSTLGDRFDVLSVTLKADLETSP